MCLEYLTYLAGLVALQELRWGSERAEEYRTTKENQQHYKLDKPNFQLSIQLGLHRV